MLYLLKKIIERIYVLRSVPFSKGICLNILQAIIVQGWDKVTVGISMAGN